MLKNTVPARIDFNIDNLPQKSTIDEIISFTYPRLRENAPAWYVEFYAFDPVRGKMRRKRIKINRLATKKQRREYAAGLIIRLYQQLIRGWNPWVEKELRLRYRLMMPSNDMWRITRRCTPMGFSEKRHTSATNQRLKSWLPIINREPHPSSTSTSWTNDFATISSITYTWN